MRRSLEGDESLAELVAAEPTLGESAVPLLAPGAAVVRRTSPGGAGPKPVALQLIAAKELLASQSLLLR
ncbi:unannotated protein [freshwater metagenome]|uniref:Unannotated protein n=1 Tax=freshwater metagenome TaxID=449393 RepID=A0A6J7EDN3_9ZZZZ